MKWCGSSRNSGGDEVTQSVKSCAIVKRIGWRRQDDTLDDVLSEWRRRNETVIDVVREIEEDWGRRFEIVSEVVTECEEE